MAAFAGDFDDGGDEDLSIPPLPPDDRLWRHPSELGGTSHSLAIDPVAVRRRWLQSEQSRASAWTAGIVGAVLATGLVALGTHLASALTGTNGSSAPETASLGAVGTTTLATVSSTSAPIAASLLGRIERVGAAVALVEVGSGAAEYECLGLVVRSDGMLLVPAADLTAATSITVTVGGVDGYVGTVVGSDPDSGVAVIHINPIRSLVTLPTSSTTPPTGTMALAVTSSNATYALGTVQSVDADPTVDGTRLVDAVQADIPVSKIGSPVLDASGNVIGMVVGRDAAGAIVTPTWIAQPIATQLISAGSVTHGWLGIVGATNSSSPRGVTIVKVEPKSPAAEAKLRPADVIVSVGSRPVHSMAALHGALYALQPGSSVRLVVRRGNSVARVHLTLDDNVPR